MYLKLVHLWGVKSLRFFETECKMTFPIYYGKLIYKLRFCKNNDYFSLSTFLCEEPGGRLSKAWIDSSQINISAAKKCVPMTRDGSRFRLDARKKESKNWNLHTDILWNAYMLHHTSTRVNLRKTYIFFKF